MSYQGYGGTAIVSADGRTITVGRYPAGGCAAMIRPVARENARQVALFLEYMTPASASASCVHATVALVDARDIRLSEPLGSRKLLDGATGRAITWISSRLVLRPAAVPAGYRLSELVPAGSLRLAQGLASAGCVQIYLSRTHAIELVITQSAGTVSPRGPGPGGWVPIRVRGHPGLAARNIITWRENGLTDSISAGTGTGENEAQVLSTRQLIAFADSAPAYNSSPVPILSP